MTDIPILFSGPMVRAILDGRKTQTRRLAKFVAIDDANLSFSGLEPDQYLPGRWNLTSRGSGGCWNVRSTNIRTPLIGDRLWVRETWQGINTENGPQLTYRATPDYFAIDAWDGPDEGVGPSFNYDRCHGTDFSAWGSDVLSNDGPWRPGIHMPRWASRLTLTVTGVRIERLQDMEGQHASESDAIAEGVNEIHHGDGHYYYSAFRDEPHPKNWIDPTDAFRELWDSINGKRPSATWDDNPWVVALTFTVSKSNIDAMSASVREDAT